MHRVLFISANTYIAPVYSARICSKRPTNSPNTRNKIGVDAFSHVFLFIHYKARIVQGNKFGRFLKGGTDKVSDIFKIIHIIV